MQLNYPVPVVIVQVEDDTARIEVVDGNLHRQDILPPNWPVPPR